MTYRSSGPSPLLIVLIGALVVFGGYYVWMGTRSFLEDRGNITADVTRQAFSTATAQAAPLLGLPTLYVPATFTPLPPCQMFRVSVERAVYRDCPSTDRLKCPVRDVVTYGTELCVYGRSPDNPEWYVVELNPNGAYRNTVYMHESVIEPVNPTPTPTVTHTPLPTVSPTPSFTPPPVVTSTPTPTPNPATPPTPTPTPMPTPTTRQVSI